MGNKSRYLDDIQSLLDLASPAPAPVLDLFAGSAVVSGHLGRTRPVVANDVQNYSGILARALLEPSRDVSSILDRSINQARESSERDAVGAVGELLAHEDEALTLAQSGQVNQLGGLIEIGPLEGLNGDKAATSEARRLAGAARLQVPRTPDNAMFLNYGGVYFSFRQALELDALARQIRSLGNPSSMLAPILSTASEVSSTVGNHFAQPVSIRTRSGGLKDKILVSTAKRRRLSVYETYRDWARRFLAIKETQFEHRFLALDFRDALRAYSSEVGVVYADPPYTRDHYSRFYHVLETLSIGDWPGLSVTMLAGKRQASKGAYRASRHQSPFSIKSQVRQAFATMFEIPSSQGVPTLLSYSPRGSGTAARQNTRLLSIEEILEIADKFYRVQELTTIAGSRHSRLNKKELHGSVPPEAEVLILLSCR